MRMKNIQYPNLAAEMSRKGIQASDIANAIDVSDKTARDKLNRNTPWLIKEMKKIRTEFFPGMTLDYLFHEEDEDNLTA